MSSFLDCWFKVMKSPRGAQAVSGRANTPPQTFCSEPTPGSLPTTPRQVWNQRGFPWHLAACRAYAMLRNVSDGLPLSVLVGWDWRPTVGNPGRQWLWGCSDRWPALVHLWQKRFCTLTLLCHHGYALRPTPDPPRLPWQCGITRMPLGLILIS